MTTQSLLAKSRPRDYSRVKPLPDPPRVPDMMEQMPAINVYITVISAWFRHRDDVFVGSGGYLWKTPDDGTGPHPDGSFVEGLVDPKRRLLHRNGYVISEEGKPPDLVLEVGSESTGRRDYTVKRETYAEYGVREYWRFDPSGGEYHDAPLAGDRLVDGEYEPIEIVSEPDGRHWGYSEVLGLEFWWVEDESGWHKGALRFRDPASGEFLRTLDESEDALESERMERAAAEARMADMEAELRRLRGE